MSNQKTNKERLRIGVRPVVSAILIIVLSACKIQVVTSDGGVVRTVSGDYECTATAFCDQIDVSDTSFTEVFVAEPEFGFRFSGWRSREKGLCGGTIAACELSTAGFEDNTSLLSFLGEDEVFFLEAVFEEDSDPGSGFGNAESCWNPSRYDVGTTVVFEREQRGVDEPGVIRSGVRVTREQKVEEEVIFQGLESRRVFQFSTLVLPDGLVRTNTRNTFVNLAANARLYELGWDLDFSEQAQLQSRVFDPPLLTRFDLAPGQSYSQYVVESAAGSFQDRPVDFQIRTIITTTFHGIESVSVPAGTFQSCRFTSIQTSGESTAKLRTWHAVGSGMLIRSVNFDSEESIDEPLFEIVLIRGTINGLDI